MYTLPARILPGGVRLVVGVSKFHRVLILTHEDNSEIKTCPINYKCELGWITPKLCDFAEGRYQDETGQSVCKWTLIGESLATLVETTVSIWTSFNSIEDLCADANWVNDLIRAYAWAAGVEPSAVSTPGLCGRRLSPKVKTTITTDGGDVDLYLDVVRKEGYVWDSRRRLLDLTITFELVV